ncbi:MAG: UDP-3-O-(3-hydroxymyristoyl)glucosamine N-acyltransferase [Bacteroidaceae bacterium]|nr:UDP-3-O-(3-hydroxymyristoyl)glucosamine N-acyltransferase [Bacteroidaceae bacterium]
MEFTAQQIADILQGTVQGNPQATVNTFAKIEEGKPGALSFLANTHYEHYLYETQSSVVLVNNDLQLQSEVQATLIRVPNAYEAVARLLQLYDAQKPRRTGIHPLAFVSDSAEVSEGAYIGAFAYIGDGAKVGRGTQVYPHVVVEERAQVGEDTILYPGVSIYHDCVVGSRVILHSGCVIGADGFGFAPTAEGYSKIPQIGNVVVEDDVEIGANSCVDRSTMGSTRIHRGVKLDNLVQVAHNCEVGSHTVMSAQVGVAGSTKIGQWCMFGGQVGITGHAVIGDRVQTGAQAGIAGSVPEGHKALLGSPAIDYKQFARATTVFKKLPEMYRELNALRAELDALKQQSSTQAQ